MKVLGVPITVEDECAFCYGTGMYEHWYYDLSYKDLCHHCHGGGKVVVQKTLSIPEFKELLKQ